MKLSAILSGVALAFQVAPTFFTVIDDTVKDIEQKFAGQPGSTKLAAASAKINTYLGVAEDDLNAIESLKAIVAPAINAAVAVANAVGLFKHGTTAAS